MKIEFSFDIRRTTIFQNLCADALFIYYIIKAGAVRTHERRKVKR